MKLLHLDSSALADQSVSRELSAAIVARWREAVPGLRVDYRDLDAEPIPHLTGPHLAGQAQAFPGCREAAGGQARSRSQGQARQRRLRPD